MPEEEIDGPNIKEKKKLKANKKASPESRCVDSWEVSTQGGVWRRQHRTHRRALFSPTELLEDLRPEYKSRRSG